MLIKKICCIGADQIGGPVCSIIALKCPEITVTVTDQDEERIMQWNSEKIPVFEPGLDEIVQKCRGKNLFFTSDLTVPIKEADAIFICNSTPVKSQGKGCGKVADFKFLEKAARVIAETADSQKIIVEKSTVPIRATETITNVLKANQPAGVELHVLSNPEFLSEGTAIQNLLNPERVLIGGEDTPQSAAAIEALISVYEHWVPRKNIITTDIASAELSKVATSAFLAQKISSINSLSEVCELTKADISDVVTALGMDSRIGNKLLEPSIGFGCPCFYQDLQNLVFLCESLNLPQVASYWQKVLDMNEYQKKRFVKKVVNSFFLTLVDKKIAILGFSIKKETGDTRESPAIFICKALLEEGAKLNIYDPVVNKKDIKKDLLAVCPKKDAATIGKVVSVCDDPFEATAGTQGIVVCTDWEEFKTLDYYKIYCDMMKPAYLFDGHNFLPHKELMEMGFEVQTIGKNLNPNFTPLF